MSVKENNCILNRRVPGYIGSAYEFTTESEFESAKVTFYIEKSLFDNEDFIPAIYYFNEEQQVLELVSDQTVDGNKVSVVLEHFSTYIVLNKVEFEKVWETEIAYFDDEEKELPLDIAFVIDASGSMSNDPQPKNDKDGLRLTLSKEMVKKMDADDRAMVIKFNSSASLLQTLTNDKTLITSAIDKVDSYSTTAMCDGIHLANVIYASQSDTNYRKIMIVITDGIDNWSRYSVTEVINEAKNNDVKIYTIGLGKQIYTSDLERIASETGGKYYYAEIATDLEDIYNEIEYETVDYTKDSNNDGISDYHTMKMCEGKLRVGTGISVFEGIPYEKIQKNDDYDGDGLKNGEEIEIRKYMTCTSIKMISDPTTSVSDMDVYNDYEEVKNYGTNPMEKNVIMESEVVDYVRDEFYYEASEYEKGFLASDKQQVLAWIGNNIYGSNYDEVEIYEDALIEYFTVINTGLEPEIESNECGGLYFEYLSEISTIIDKAYETLKDKGDAIDRLIDLDKQIEHLKASAMELIKNPGLFTKIDIYAEFDKLQEYLHSAAQESEDIKNVLKGDVTVKGKFTILAQGKTTGKIVKGISITSSILGTAQSLKEGWEDYIALKANLEVMESNIYILEVLSEGAYNENVKKAATSLLDVTSAKYVSGTTEILESWNREAINGILHSALIKFTSNGFWIEVGLMLGDNIFGISYETENAVRVCGDSCMANELAIDFYSDICTKWHYKANGQLTYVIYGDSAKGIVNKYINLVEMRKLGETHMINFQNDASMLTEHLLEILGDSPDEVIKDCESTINKLLCIRYRYKFKCF